jgi:adenylyl-sulfate kinase
MDAQRQSTGFTVWFTGMTGSGKTVLANHIARRLAAIGRRVEILDGNDMQEHLAKGLGPSKEERNTLVRRMGVLARLLSRNDVVTICSAISPYRDAREQVRREIKRFVEVFVDCPMEKLLERDAKGFYKKALAGEIKNVPGIDDPYEPPTHPELLIRSDQEPVEQALARIFQQLVDLKYISPAEFSKLTGGLRPKRARPIPAAARRSARATRAKKPMARASRKITAKARKSRR